MDASTTAAPGSKGECPEKGLKAGVAELCPDDEGVIRIGDDSCDGADNQAACVDGMLCWVMWCS